MTDEARVQHVHHWGADGKCLQPGCSFVTDEAQAGEPRRLDAFELAQNVEREMVRAAPPKIEGGSEARRQWLADVLAVQMAFHESGAGIEFTRAFDDNPFSESAPPVAPLGETDR